VSHPSTRFWNGTVGEVLAIVAVVMILAAIFFPVTGGGGPSLRAACISNVKQLGLGILLYSEDCDERTPPRDTWMDSIQRWVKNPGIDHCPAVKGADLYGYAFNPAVTRMNRPSDSTTPLVYDSVNLAKNASDFVTSLPVPGRHSGRDSIVYADCHVKAVDPTGKAAP